MDIKINRSFSICGVVMKKSCLFLLMLVTLFQYACAASYGQKRSQELMQEAIDSNSKGEAYSAITKGLDSIYYDYKNEEAKRFVIANYNRAVDHKVDMLNKMIISIDNLKQFRDELTDLKVTQDKLKGHKFIHADVVDIDALRNRYETSVIQEAIKEIDSFLKQGNAEKAKNQLDRYKELGLPTNEQFVSLINRLQILYLSQNNYVSLIEFTKTNKEFTKGEALNEICKGLLGFAASDENTNKRRALETYLLLLELGKGDETVRIKIDKLRNDLITMFAVLDLENQTDEFIPVDNKEFVDRVKRGLDDNKKLIEVVLKDDGINEMKDRLINYDYFKNKKDINVNFENNIRYLIVPKIANLNINRQSPTMITKNADWDFKSTGDAIATGLNMFEAYGSYKVQYFQYDEYTEKVKGRMVTDIILYDIVQKKVILKDRVEASAADSVTWAENPMAVGIVNKIPASFYPPKIQVLMNQKRSPKTDDELKKNLTSQIIADIVNKAKSVTGSMQKPSREEYDNLLKGVIVQDLTPEIYAKLNLPSRLKGAVVADVDNQSPATMILKHGDVIQEMNRQKITNIEEYERVVSMIKPGQDIVILIFRGGSSTFITLSGK